MSRFDKYLGHGSKMAKTHYKEGEDVTRQGLAYTPADMERMTAQGLPIQSGEIAAKFYDGDQGSDFLLTSDRIKGNDVNDLWEEHRSIIKKAKKAYQASQASKRSSKEPKKD